jgi:flagellar biogenesis protein FliO
MNSSDATTTMFLSSRIFLVLSLVTFLVFILPRPQQHKTLEGKILCGLWYVSKGESDGGR